jgi:tetratricopeptide (TPR) repeat protein
MTLTNSRLFLAGCVFLIVSTAAVYWQVSRFDFVNYDDPTYVTENPNVLQGFTWEGIKWAFTSFYASNWHPLTWLSLMLDRELFGTGPRAFHLVSVLLHIANTVLLFIVMVRLSGASWPSFFVAAAFGLHPLHVESVVWVAERKDALSTLFWMLTMLAYVRYVERPTVGRYAAISAVYALGLMAKPMLVTLPFVLLILDWWPLERIKPHSQAESASATDYKCTVSHLVLEKIPLFVLSALSGVMTFIAQRSGGTMSGLQVFSLSNRISNALVSYASYIVKMFWPSGLTVFYPHPQGNLADWKIIASLAVLVGVSILVFVCRRRRYLMAGWLWYLGTLVPVIGLVQVGTQGMADRYTYIPLTGLFIMAAWSVRDIASRWRYKKALTAAVGPILYAALMVCTFRQVGYWQDSITLFGHAINVTTGNYVAHNNLGTALAEKGDIEAAMKQFEATLAIRPDDIDAHYNLAKALAKTGRTQEAAEHYNKVLNLKPDAADVFVALALEQTEQGQFEQAAATYRKGLEAAPQDGALHSGLGLVLLQMGRVDEAITELQTAVKLKGDSKAYCNLGAAVSSKGQLDEATVYYKKSIRLDPKNAEAYFNLGNMYLSQGRLPEAVAEYKKAIDARPGYVKAYGNLAVALAQIGKLGEAVESFRRVVELEPNNPDAHFNLASALADKGLVNEAAGHLRKVVDLAPQDVNARCMLADLLVRQHKVEQAIAEYEEVLKTDPTHQRARLGLQKALAINKTQ